MVIAFTRREMLGTMTAGLGAAVVGVQPGQPPRRGAVVGHPEGERAGQAVLDAGGNAADAAVTAALVAGVVAVHMCGIGGYGGHLVVARPGRRPVAIDFNSTAPQAARPDMFPLDADGRVRGRVNEVGWFAAGVPGTLAGLQLALDRFGTLPFRRAVEPALRYARDGFDVNVGLANSARAARVQLARDAGSARLMLPDGEPIRAGSRFRNPRLASMLETLAEANSAEPFYRGDVARRIAAAFRANGGLVTADDFAAYRAREVETLELTWRGCTTHTAPLTAGGLTILQALATLKATGWEQRNANDARTTHLLVESLRLAWDDRLRLLGDPDHADVPMRRLLSDDHARRCAARADEAVRQGRALAIETDGRPADGTIHLSAVDADGMMVALTLTHGGAFGAQVTVDEFGLVLGHGMSRFDARPNHPNAPGPRKRPLHNMCPAVVLREGRPVLALGGRGGRRIPNAVFGVLASFVGRQQPLADAVAAPRLHTEGDVALVLERGWPEDTAARLREAGFRVTQGASAAVHAVERDAAGAVRSAGR